MYTIKEEVYVLIYLILFGIFIFSTLDILEKIILKLKIKILKILIDVLYIIGITYIIYIFSYNLMDGYVPIYFILFIYIGYVIYIKLCKKTFNKIIDLIFKVIIKINFMFKHLISHMLLSKETKKFIKREKRIINNAIISIKKNKK